MLTTLWRRQGWVQPERAALEEEAEEADAEAPHESDDEEPDNEGAVLIHVSHGLFSLRGTPLTGEDDGGACGQR